MPWFKVDDGFYDHPKVVELSLAAVGLWTLAGSYCAKHLTDGRLTRRTVGRLSGTDALVTELTDAGLWHEVVDEKFDLEFNDWTDYQPTRLSVVTEREAARVRVAALRASRKGTSQEAKAKSAGTTGVRSAEQTGERSGEQPDDVQPPRPNPTQPDPTQPSPSPSEKKKSPARSQGSRISRDFEITPEMRKWAEVEVPRVDIDAALPEWIDYWVGVAGAKGVKLDWPATWRNGMRRKQGWQDENGRGAPGTPSGPGSRPSPDAWMQPGFQKPQGGAAA